MHFRQFGILDYGGPQSDCYTSMLVAFSVAHDTTGSTIDSVKNYSLELWKIHLSAHRQRASKVAISVSLTSMQPAS